MFGLFRRKENFEWKKHVRTTVRLRRADRKRKIEAAKGAVVEGVKEAGVRSISAGGNLLQRSWWGLIALFSGIGSVLGRLLGLLLSSVSGAGRVLGWGLDRAQTALAPVLRAMIAYLSQKPVRLVAAVVAGAAATWAASRYRAEGLDGEVQAALLIGLIGAFVAMLPIIAPPVAAGWTALASLATAVGEFVRERGGPRAHQVVRLVAAVVVAVVALGAGYVGVGWMAGSIGTPSSLVASLPSLPRLSLVGAPEITGRGFAVAGDTLRIDGKLIGLAGIEAPDYAQRCARGQNRRWRCGVAATDALAQILRKGPIACAPTGAEDRGRQMARCRINGDDIAAELVKAGAVFATPGLLAAYGSAEATAKAQKAGLWAGEADRPQVWRAKLFDEAKRRAPNSCPVKGVKVSNGLRYIMPWQEEYERTRVRASRGERWFCSEAEAQAAGYKLAS